MPGQPASGQSVRLARYSQVRPHLGKSYLVLKLTREYICQHDNRAKIKTPMSNSNNFCEVLSIGRPDKFLGDLQCQIM